MPLYRDSKNEWSFTAVDDAGAAQDVSARDWRMELYQNGTTVTLSMGDGISFETDGTDGVINYLLSMDRTNQFCAGTVRIRQFDDSGDDPLLTHEGTETIEGKTFDA